MKKQSICLKNDVGFENTSSQFFIFNYSGQTKTISIQNRNGKLWYFCSQNQFGLKDIFFWGHQTENSSDYLSMDCFCFCLSPLIKLPPVPLCVLFSVNPQWWVGPSGAINWKHFHQITLLPTQKIKSNQNQIILL